MKKRKKEEEPLVKQHLWHDMRAIGEQGKDRNSCLRIMSCYKSTRLTILSQIDFVQMSKASSEHITYSLSFVKFMKICVEYRFMMFKTQIQ